uniref:Uncharacterized protein n=2 Tax=Parascaris univalens TaxID=6257 RepID=A0A914ZY33_PARUN
MRKQKAVQQTPSLRAMQCFSRRCMRVCSLASKMGAEVVVKMLLKSVMHIGIVNLFIPNFNPLGYIRIALLTSEGCFKIGKQLLHFNPLNAAYNHSRFAATDVQQ